MQKIAVLLTQTRQDSQTSGALDTLRTALRQLGCEVLNSTDISDAVQCLSSNRASIVFSTVSVGDSEQSAFDLLDALRREEIEAKLVVVATPKWTSDSISIAEVARMSGADYLNLSRVEGDDLAAYLESLLS